MEAISSPEHNPDLPTEKPSAEKLPSELTAILESMYSLGVLARGELDSRAIDAVKELSSEERAGVFEELQASNLEHVGNKSAFLCGLIKSRRQKARKMMKTGQVQMAKAGPDEQKLKEILARTGYSLDVSTGQRKYGGPPPNWNGAAPGSGHEIYCGKIPKDMFEDSLIPIFEKFGAIWDLRLMMDPITTRNRGYCFVTYTEPKSAQEAVRELNNFEISPGKRMRVNITVANARLFVGNIPKNRSRDDLLTEFQKHSEGLLDVIVYGSPDDPKKKNRGFAFLDYANHKMASAALRQMTRARLHIWGLEIILNWAQPQEEPNEETMSRVKVLYVCNLKSDITDAQLREKFEPFGAIDRVKKVKGYGFVHFAEREAAVKAMEQLNGTKLGDLDMEISLAKPLSRNRRNRQKNNAYNNFMYSGYENPWIGYHADWPSRRGNKMRDNYYTTYSNEAFYPGYNMQPTFYDYYGAGGRYGGVYGYNDQRYGYAPAYQQGPKQWYAQNNQRGMWGAKAARGNNKTAPKV